MLWTAMIGFFAGSLLFSGAVAVQCSEYEMKQCMMDLENMNQGFLMHAHKEQLETVCRKITEVQPCLKRLGCADNSPAMIGWNMVKKALDYVCYAKKQVYLDNMECFNSKTLETQVASCGNITPSPGAYRAQSSACTAINQQIACVKNTVTAACNKEAGNFMKVFIMQIVKPATMLIDCKLDEDDNDWDDDGMPDKEGFPLSYTYNHSTVLTVNLVSILTALSLSIYMWM